MRRLFLLLIFFLNLDLAFGQGQSREVFICKNASIRLKAESTGASKYEWYRNNELVVGVSEYELVVSEEGYYKAFGVNKDGCLSKESISIIVKHHKPTAVDDIWTIRNNKEVVLDVLVNDQKVCADLDPATLALHQLPATGTATVVNGKLHYSPVKGFEGDVRLTYSVTDKSGTQTNIANVVLNIDSEPLPVTLAMFEVDKTESMAVARWATVTEANSDHFDLQRSIDHTSWTNLGTVSAAFNSAALQNYTFTDSLPESGINYYRLKMVDADGTFAFSKIKAVHFPEFAWAEIFPNPVEDQLNVIIRNKKVNKFRMISANGVVHINQPVVSRSFVIGMKSYPTGMYILHFEQDDGTVKVFKLAHY
jgi:hypothetical protein